MKKVITLLCFLLIISLFAGCLILGITPVRCISKVTQTSSGGSVVTVDVDCDRYVNALKYRKEWDNAFVEESFTFDHRGNILTKTRLDSVLNQPRTTTYQYDDHGNLISQNNDPNNFYKYTYDENGVMIKKCSISSGKLGTIWTYDSNGNWIESYNPDASHFLYSYNAQNHLTATYQVKNGKKILSSLFTYSENGKMLHATHYNILDDGTQQLYLTDTFTYDSQGNALERYRDFGSSYVKNTWTYDEAGRKLTEDSTSSYSSPSRKEWTYDESGRLKTYRSGDSQTTWTYDIYGNVVDCTRTVGESSTSTKISYVTLYLPAEAAARVQSLQELIIDYLAALLSFSKPELP